MQPKQDAALMLCFSFSSTHGEAMTSYLTIFLKIPPVMPLTVILALCGILRVCRNALLGFF
jgi:hypothetical protein